MAPTESAGMGVAGAGAAAGAAAAGEEMGSPVGPGAGDGCPLMLSSDLRLLRPNEVDRLGLPPNPSCSGAPPPVLSGSRLPVRLRLRPPRLVSAERGDSAPAGGGAGPEGGSRV